MVTSSFNMTEHTQQQNGPDGELEELLSRKKVAQILDTHTETIKRMTRSGQLRAVRFNSRNVRYRKSDVMKLIEEASE